MSGKKVNELQKSVCATSQKKSDSLYGGAAPRFGFRRSGKKKMLLFFSSCSNNTFRLPPPKKHTCNNHRSNSKTSTHFSRRFVFLCLPSRDAVKNSTLMSLSALTKKHQSQAEFSVSK